jgi:hypothetical protein
MFSPLKTKLLQMLFKNSVRTSKRTPYFNITTIKWLTPFKEIIAVYSEKDTKPINTTSVKKNGTYSYGSALEVQQKYLMLLRTQLLYGFHLIWNSISISETLTQFI